MVALGLVSFRVGVRWFRLGLGFRVDLGLRVGCFRGCAGSVCVWGRTRGAGLECV